MGILRVFRATLALAVLLGSMPMRAEQLERSGYWAGFDVGAGFLERSRTGRDDSSTDLYLGMKVGYTVTPRILAAIELSGWLQEATNRQNPTEGEGLMQVFLVSRLYPLEDAGLFAKVGGGWLRQWNNEPGRTSLDGWGVVVGAGYDFALSKRYAVTPFLNFSYGDAGSQEHQAVTVGVGLTIQ